MNVIEPHIEQIRNLCVINEVNSLFVFGSAVRDDLGPESDVDLLVDIGDSDSSSYADKYFNLKFELEKLFRRHIDLLEQQTLSNPYVQREIDETKILLYGG